MPDLPQLDPTRHFDAPQEPSGGGAAHGAPAYAPGMAGESLHVSGDAADGGREVLYVPLAVTVGDGFKFGCGFFMAFVVMLLIAFVLTSALFALTSVMGLNLPVGR